MPYPSAVVSDSTVIFAHAPLAGGKRRIYTVWAEIGNGATSPLVFLSKLTKCLQAAANDVTVGIVGVGKWSIQICTDIQLTVVAHIQ